MSVCVYSYIKLCIYLNTHTHTHMHTRGRTRRRTHAHAHAHAHAHEHEHAQIRHSATNTPTQRHVDLGSITDNNIRDNKIRDKETATEGQTLAASETSSSLPAPNSSSSVCAALTTLSKKAFSSSRTLPKNFVCAVSINDFTNTCMLG